MAHFAKYARGSCASITQHDERKKNEKGEYLKFKNQQIDSNRTYLNYNLGPKREISQLEFIKQRTEDLHCLKRKDVNVLGSWVVTAPKELPAEQIEDFFNRSYAFLENKYGRANVVSSFVHLDELQPHMHFTFVPVVYDPKKKREKVSCKECVTRLDLKQFHTEFQSEMDKWCEVSGRTFECNVLNGATANGNKTVEQMKAEKIADKNKDMLHELEDYRQIEYRYQKSLNALHEQRNSLQMEINSLQDKIESLQEKKDSLHTNKTVLALRFIENPKIKPIFEKFCEVVIESVRKIKADRTEQSTSHPAEGSTHSIQSWEQIMDEKRRKHMEERQLKEHKPSNKDKGWER